MQHYWSLEDVHLHDTWLTIGSFDGVHRGHQEIIQHLAAGAHAVSAPAVVLTFFPHPAVVLGKRQDPFYLTSPDEKAALLGSLGVDFVITHPFNHQVAKTTAREFVSRLHQHLNFSHLWVGYDFALGRGREGDIPTLRSFGEQFGYTLHVVDPVTSSSETISSSQIRKALAEGNVELSAHLLGRPYLITGKVVHGDGRGRSLGIPTANLQVWPERALPKSGVYVCQARVAGKTWGAVTNVGVRPTFENQPESPRVEAHILEFDKDLYDQKLQLEFIARLRDERRFSSIQELVAQIQRDIEQAREVLTTT